MPLAWGGGIFGGGGGGAGSSGTGAAGRVSVWTGPGTIGGYAGFTFDSATNKATLLGGLIDSALTAGRVVIVGTAGELEDDPGFLYAKTTDTLTLASGTVDAGLIKATSLATPGSITVTPKLTQTGAITTVAVGTRPTGTITCIRVATRATGLITCVAKANLIDGETVTIDDGTGAEVFEFDLVPDGVGVGNVTVDVSTATTAEDVAALLSAAIVATFGAGTATNNLDGTITYQSNVFGVAGNIASSDTVADLGFSITGLSGAVAGIMDGETVTIDDGVSPATVFEFDISGGGVTPGNTAVVLNEGDLGATVAAALSPMINGIGAGLLVTSAVNGGTPEQLDLTGDAYNATGNVAITDTVVDAGFTVAGMSGGVDGLLDNETLILDDGTTAYTFQFNTGGIVPPTSVAVPIVEGQSADTVKTNLIAIINNTAILMTATDGGVATINLAQDTPGNLGGANSDTVANAGFAVTGMTSPAAATTVTYKLVARLADGTATEAGAASSTAASTATLSTSNLNRLTWSAVPNAVSYDVYRTVAPTSPATTGVIVASTTALTVDDTGLAGGGETAPTSNSTGRLVSTALTSGRVALVGTGGQIVDDAGLTYSGTGATARMAASGFGAVDDVIPATWFAASTTSNGLAAIKRWGGFDYGFVGNYDTGLYLGSAGTVRWTSTSFGDGTPDTSLSRIAAGVVGAGTGAAGSYDGDVYAGAGYFRGSSASPKVWLQVGTPGTSYFASGSFTGGIRTAFLASAVLSYQTVLAWVPTGDPFNDTADLLVSRRAAATLQLGAADSATPVPQTLAFQGSRGGTDTNVAGADATVQGSLGTGTAASGKLVFKVGTPQNSGTDQHVPATVLTLQDTGTGGVAAPQVVVPAGTNTKPGLMLGASGIYDDYGTLTTAAQVAIHGDTYFAGNTFLSSLGGTSALNWYGGAGSGYDIGLRRYGVNQLLVTNASTGTGGLLARYHGTEITSDAVIQVGQTVMPDAGTDGRFDINTGSATTAIGVLTGTGPAAQGTNYGVAVSGIAYVCPATGQNVTRGHFLVQSATAGVVDDSATIGAAGLTIAKSLYSEAADVLVSATATTDVIVLMSAPGWAVNDPVVYYTAGGAAIAGLTSGNVYWIKTISSADVTLSATRGGAVVDITADGTISTQYLQRLPQAVVNIQ